MEPLLRRVYKDGMVGGRLAAAGVSGIIKRRIAEPSIMSGRVCRARRLALKARPTPVTHFGQALQSVGRAWRQCRRDRARHTASVPTDAAALRKAGGRLGSLTVPPEGRGHWSGPPCRSVGISLMEREMTNTSRHGES